jgi:hypothetical protein
MQKSHYVKLLNNKEGKLNRRAKNVWLDGCIKLYLFIYLFIYGLLNPEYIASNYKITNELKRTGAVVA